MMDKINLTDKFSLIHEHWKPHIAGELNGQLIKLVKFQGEFVRHHHDHEDEMFLVVRGRFRIEFRAGEGGRATNDQADADKSVRATHDRATQADKTVTIEEGEFIVVPRGVEHKPVADEECWVMLFEPTSTLNTGNVVNERTVRQLKRL